MQYRQLLDLVGTLPAEARSEQIDAAHVRMGELERQIPAAERAAMLRDPALRLRSPRLVAALAAQDPAVAAAAMARVELDEEQWLDLIPALPVRARGFIRLRRDLPPAVEPLLERLGIHDRALPDAAREAADRPAGAAIPLWPDRPEPLVETAPETAPPPMATAADTGGASPRLVVDNRAEGIGAIVRKIEAFRRQRQVADAESPRLPLGEEHVLQMPARLRAFDFATDVAGRIVWADPGAAPMAIGLGLAALDETGAVRAAPALARALKRRQPLQAERLTIDGAPAIAGDWQVDAAPWFDPLTGAFCGFRGRMRRPAEAAAPAAPPRPDSAADRIRQLLHELRTPVNAIQGFAEVIQQQLFGPSPHEYRALAAAIAGDAARMLAAFEELERLARLDSGALEIERGASDFAAVVAATVDQLRAHCEPRGSGFELRSEAAELPVDLSPIEAERIVWRLLATLAGTSAPGEQLRLRLRERHGSLRLTVALPAALAARSDSELMNAAPGAIPQAIAAGMFGVGFALRLAAAEARAAGGALERRDGKLRLWLPLARPAGLTAAPPAHSESTGDRGNSAA